MLAVCAWCVCVDVDVINVHMRSHINTLYRSLAQTRQHRIRAICTWAIFFVMQRHHPITLQPCLRMCMLCMFMCVYVLGMCNAIFSLYSEVSSTVCRKPASRVYHRTPVLHSMTQRYMHCSTFSTWHTQHIIIVIVGTRRGLEGDVHCTRGRTLHALSIRRICMMMMHCM